MKDNSNRRLPKLRIMLPPTLQTPRIARAVIEKGSTGNLDTSNTCFLRRGEGVT